MTSMKFSIDAQTFAKALNAVRGAAGGGAAGRAVLLDVRTEDGGTLAVTASDTTLQSTWSIGCTVGTPGRAVLDLNDLLTVAKSLPKKGDVLVEVGKAAIDLIAGSARFRFPVLPAETFLAWDGTVAGGVEATLAADAFSTMLSKVMHAVAGDDGNLDQLKGVLLANGPQGLRAVATDGHRLALCDMPQLQAALPAGGIIVPARAAREIVRLCQGIGMIGLTATKTALRIDGGPEMLLSKLIDAPYPDYERILQSDLPHALEVPRAEFLAAVERVGAILTRTPILRLTFDAKGFHLRADREQASALETVMGTDIPAEARLALGLNARYLADALKALSSPVVRLAYAAPDQLVALTGANDAGVRHVMMPARL